MFLHHILTREDDSLILRFYQVQKSKPIKNDWCLIVREDLKSIGLEQLTDEKIKSMSSDAVKKVVKEKISESAFRNLKLSKSKLKKLDSLSYDQFAMQDYLKSNLSKEEKHLLFRWRTKMIAVKSNLGVKDSLCPLCKCNEDTQEHLLSCKVTANSRCGELLQDVRTALRIREIEGEKMKMKKSTRETPNDTPGTVPMVATTDIIIADTIDEEELPEPLETSTETIPYEDEDAEKYVIVCGAVPDEKMQQTTQYIKSSEDKAQSMPIRRSSRGRMAKMKSSHDHLGGKLVMVPVGS